MGDSASDPMSAPTDEAAATAPPPRILAAVALGFLVSPHWYYCTAFVGLNLFQSAFSGWCPMMAILRKLGVPDTALAGRNS